MYYLLISSYWVGLKDNFYIFGNCLYILIFKIYKYYMDCDFGDEVECLYDG